MIHSRVPTARAALVFSGKASVLRLLRTVADLRSRPRRFRGDPSVELASRAVHVDQAVLAESTNPLWSASGEANAAERALELGKVQNLRVALRRLNGIVVPANATFSFWRQIGRATRRRGYVRGRELREGCLVPSVGGGLCQLSNALYDAALRAGCEIVERHAHTAVVPGSLAEHGRDATVFWNYVDLRFRPRCDLRVEAVLDRDALTVRLLAVHPAPADVACSSSVGTYGAPTKITTIPSGTDVEPGSAVTPDPDASGGRYTAPPVSAEVATLVAVHASTAVDVDFDLDDALSHSSTVGSCASCGVSDCFRHARTDRVRARGARTAYLLDAYWPEYDAYVASLAGRDDIAFVPVDGRRYRVPSYRWDLSRFGMVRQSAPTTVRRALDVRRSASRGAAAQRLTQLRWAALMAHGYARRLPYDVEHVVVMQPLLPYMWSNGDLGGRSFDVLMTGLPMRALQRTLDVAHALHPESPTLRDFRADPALVEAEEQALAAARAIVTPHATIAAMFGARTVLVPWIVSQRSNGEVAPSTAMQSEGGIARTTTPRSTDGTAASARSSSAASVSPDDARVPAIVFGGSTAGRSGAYEVRHVARALGLRVILTGAEFEGPGFWSGVSTERAAFADAVASGAPVVLPAFVEHQPRRLLAAAAAGTHVIASDACGLGSRPNVVTVPAGDAGALRAAVAEALRAAVTHAVGRSPGAFSGRRPSVSA